MFVVKQLPSTATRMTFTLCYLQWRFSSCQHNGWTRGSHIRLRVFTGPQNSWLVNKSTVRKQRCCPHYEYSKTAEINYLPRSTSPRTENIMKKWTICKWEIFSTKLCKNVWLWIFAKYWINSVLSATCVLCLLAFLKISLYKKFSESKWKLLIVLKNNNPPKNIHKLLFVYLTFILLEEKVKSQVKFSQFTVLILVFQVLQVHVVYFSLSAALHCQTNLSLLPVMWLKFTLLPAAVRWFGLVITAGNAGARADFKKGMAGRIRSAASMQVISHHFLHWRSKSECFFVCTKDCVYTASSEKRQRGELQQDRQQLRWTRRQCSHTLFSYLISKTQSHLVVSGNWS